MPKCPECGKEIDELVNFDRGSMEYRCYYDTHWMNMEYDSSGFISDEGEQSYECPECGAELFTTEDEAIEFFKRKKNISPKEMTKNAC